MRGRQEGLVCVLMHAVAASFPPAVLCWRARANRLLPLCTMAGAAGCTQMGAGLRCPDISGAALAPPPPLAGWPLGLGLAMKLLLAGPQC